MVIIDPSSATPVGINTPAAGDHPLLPYSNTEPSSAVSDSGETFFNSPIEEGVFASFSNSLTVSIRLLNSSADKRPREFLPSFSSLCSTFSAIKLFSKY